MFIYAVKVSQLRARNPTDGVIIDMFGSPEEMTGYARQELDVSADILSSPESIDMVSEEPSVPEPTPMTRSGGKSPYRNATSTQPGSTDGGEDRETAGGVHLDEQGDAGSMEDEATGESVAECLATELQNDEVTDENLDILAMHFDASQSRSGSDATRLNNSRMTSGTSVLTRKPSNRSWTRTEQRRR